MSNQKLEDAAAQWTTGRPIADHFPLNFDDDRSIETFTVQCGNCHGTLEGDPVRGTLTRYPETVATLRGFAYCAHCDHLTPFHARWRANAKGPVVLERPDEHGRWNQVTSKRGLFRKTTADGKTLTRAIL